MTTLDDAEKETAKAQKVPGKAHETRVRALSPCAALLSKYEKATAAIDAQEAKITVEVTAAERRVAVEVATLQERIAAAVEVWSQLPVAVRERLTDPMGAARWWGRFLRFSGPTAARDVLFLHAFRNSRRVFPAERRILGASA